MALPFMLMCVLVPVTTELVPDNKLLIKEKMLTTDDLLQCVFTVQNLNCFFICYSNVAGIRSGIYSRFSSDSLKSLLGKTYWLQCSEAVMQCL